MLWVWFLYVVEIIVKDKFLNGFPNWISSYLTLKKKFMRKLCPCVINFGVWKSHSTLHTLTVIVEDIRKSLDNGEFACGVFFDLQKAFDTADHQILISKFDHYGIRRSCKN